MRTHGEKPGYWKFCPNESTAQIRRCNPDDGCPHFQVHAESTCSLFLRQNLVHDMTMHVGQAVIATGNAIDESLMIETEQMQ